MTYDLQDQCSSHWAVEVAVMLTKKPTSFRVSLILTLFIDLYRKLIDIISSGPSFTTYALLDQSSIEYPWMTALTVKERFKASHWKKRFVCHGQTWMSFNTGRKKNFCWNMFHAFYWQHRVSFVMRILEDPHVQYIYYAICSHTYISYIYYVYQKLDFNNLAPFSYSISSLKSAK